jgi:hypothetical protein
MTRIIVFFITLFLFVNPVKSQQVRIAYVGEAIHNIPLYIGQKHNWFGSKLDIKVERYPDFNMVVQNIAYRNLETTFIATALSVINAVNAGMPIGIARIVVNEFPGALIANKPYTSLKGLRITYAGPAPEQIVYMEPLLKKYNTRVAEFETIFAGSTPLRFSILMSNNADAAILNPPLEIKALNTQKFFNLGYISDFRTRLPWATMAFNINWAKENIALVLELESLYDRTINYFYDPQNKEEIINLLIERIKISKEEATKGYELYYDNKYFTLGKEIPRDKLEELIKLFQKYEKTNMTVNVNKMLIHLNGGP